MAPAPGPVTLLKTGSRTMISRPAVISLAQRLSSCGAVAGGVVAWVAAAFADGKVDGAAAGAGVLCEPAEAAFNGRAGGAVIAVRVGVLAMFAEQLQCAADVVLDLADGEGQGESGASGLRAAPRCRRLRSHLTSGGNAEDAGEEQGHGVVHAACLLGSHVWTVTVRPFCPGRWTVTLLMPSRAFWLAEAAGEGRRRRAVGIGCVPGAFLGDGDGGCVRAVLQLCASRSRAFRRRRRWPRSRGGPPSGGPR